MSKSIGHFIGGKAVSGTSGNAKDIYNPATGEVTGQVALASAEELNGAVETAKAALPGWRNTAPISRARLMFRYKELVEANHDKLAALISEEHGKTLSDAKGEVTRGIEVVEFACGIPHLLRGDYTENVGTNVDAYTIRQPVGVCAGITPFNFPAMVPMWMFPMAIACGNTFILKPSERDPSAPMLLAELLKEAGCPDGVMNVVNGDKTAVDAILTNPDIGAVSFVGSTPIAQYIYSTGTAHNKRVQALGGAKNHMIIMPDADLDQATDALMGAGYGSAGERCMAISVAVPVGAETADALVEKLAPKVRALKVAPGNDPEAEMGPLVTREALDRVKGLVDSGVEQGAELVVDGRDLSLQGYENGFFLGGCLFDKVTPEMDIYKEEIFGPVLSMVRAKDYEDAVELVENNPYGNGTAIFTRDGDAARAFTNRINVGMVGVNVPIPVPVAYHSFGGWKNSLFGDHHMHGMEGVRFYTKQKAVTTRWPTGIREGAEFVIPTLR